MLVLTRKVNEALVIAEKVRDYSHWLGRVRAGSRDFR